jgi:hypothetical protein
LLAARLVKAPAKTANRAATLLTGRRWVIWRSFLGQAPGTNLQGRFEGRKLARGTGVRGAQRLGQAGLGMELDKIQA